MRRWSGLEAKCPRCHIIWERLPWQEVCDSCGLEAMPRADTPVEALQRPVAPRWAWCSIDRRFEPYGTRKHRTRRHA